MSRHNRQGPPVQGDVIGKAPHPNNNNLMTLNAFPDNQKIPNVKGEKTIVCWNCMTVLMVKDEWSVVKCTNCDKINRVPGTEDNVDSMIRLNDNMNHFDLYVPYVYAIITCPFCQYENKVRKDAEHIVCFQCHNSFNLLRDNNWVNPPKDNANVSPQPEQPPIVVPPQGEKDHSCEETQRLLKKLIKQLSKPKPVIAPTQYVPDNRYKIMRQLVRDVDHIDDIRGIGIGRAGGIGVGYAGRRNNSAYYHHRDDYNRYINDNDGINVDEYMSKLNKPLLKKEEENEYLKSGGFESMSEMESLKKKLYEEIKNDPKYKRGKIDNERKYNNEFTQTFSQRKRPLGSQFNSKEERNDAVYKLMFTQTKGKSNNETMRTPSSRKSESYNPYLADNDDYYSLDKIRERTKNEMNLFRRKEDDKREIKEDVEEEENDVIGERKEIIEENVIQEERKQPFIQREERVQLQKEDDINIQMDENNNSNGGVSNNNNINKSDINDNKSNTNYSNKENIQNKSHYSNKPQLFGGYVFDYDTVQ